METTHPYIELRMRLIEYLKKYGTRDLLEPDLSHAKDKTTALVRSWLDGKAEETKLRHDTLNCITFSPKGDVEVHDPEVLESLNSRISALMALRETMESSIERLSATPDFLVDLRKARNRALQVIEDAPATISRNLGAILNSYSAPSLEAAQHDPTFLKVKAEIESRADEARTRLAQIGPKISIIEEQLSICNKATSEQPKTDEPIKHFDAVVGRADVGGAV